VMQNAYTLRMIAQDSQQKIREIVERVVGRGQVRVYVFGSQARGTARFGSDIDIGIERLDGKPLSPGMLEDTKDAFEDSSIVERVDVVDFARAAPSFKAKALEHAIAV